MTRSCKDSSESTFEEQQLPCSHRYAMYDNGEGSKLTGSGGGVGDLVDGHGSFKLLMPAEQEQRERR